MPPVRWVRILHAVHAYPPTVGGSEAVIARLSHGLVERGHEVDVATRAHPDRADDVDGVPVHGFPDNPVGWARYRSFVHQGLDEGRWEVVLTYHSKVWTHLALLPFDRIAEHWVYAPTEFTDIDSRHPRHVAYYKTIEPRSLRRAARVMVLTHEDAQRAISLAGGEIEDRLEVIPNGVDHAWWSRGQAGDVRSRYDLPTEAPLVVYAGGLWEHKDVETLVRGMAEIPEAHLVVAGSDKGRRQLVDRVIRDEGVEARVHLVGRIPRKDLRALYHAGSVHASASTNEGFGLTYLEAMACGLPVVARAVGVIPTLADQGADVWVAKDAPSFAKAIREAMAHGSEANRALAEGYDWENVIDRVEACYQEVVG